MPLILKLVRLGCSGKLEAVALDAKNNEVARFAIVSSEAPYKLIVKSVQSSDETAQILLEVVDKDGVRVMLSDHEITCAIKGPATLLGLEAGNNSDMTDYTDDRQRVYNGRLLAYIKINNTSEPVTVTFSSPWLLPVEVRLPRP